MIVEEVAYSDFEELMYRLKYEGFSVSQINENLYKVGTETSEPVKVTLRDGLVSIYEGSLLNKLIVLKHIVGGAEWVDKCFIEAFENAVKRLIRNHDSDALIRSVKVSKHIVNITYDNEPVIKVDLRDGMPVINGYNDQWNKAIPEILHITEEYLPKFFFDIPIEWTIVGFPIVDNEEWGLLLDSSEHIDLMGLVLGYIAQRPLLVNIMNQLIDEFFRQGGWLEEYATEQGFPYQERKGQIEMAQEVLKTLLDTEKRLVIEAPTGTGKTFAYLVPVYVLAWMIKRTVESQVASNLIVDDFKQVSYRVAVSTHTITLQKQIYYKDLPVIDHIFKRKLGFSLFYAMAMGRNNYVCLRQAHEFISSVKNSLSGRLQGIDDETMKKREEFVGYVEEILDNDNLDNGLIDELRNKVWEGYDDLFSEMAENIQSDRHNTLGKQCPFYEKCYYYRSKGLWESADILIMNHYLLALIFDLRPKYFRTIKGVIVDEGHHFPEVVRSLKGRIDLSVMGIARSIGKKIKRLAEIKEWLKGQGIPYRLAFLRNNMPIVGNHVYNDYAKAMEKVEKRFANLKIYVNDIIHRSLAEIVALIKPDQDEGVITSIPIKPFRTVVNDSIDENADNWFVALKKLYDVITNLKQEIDNLRVAVSDVIGILKDGYERAVQDMPSGSEAEALGEYINITEESVFAVFSAHLESLDEFSKNIKKLIEQFDDKNDGEKCTNFAYWIDLRRDRRAKNKEKFIMRFHKQAVFPDELCSEILLSNDIPFVFTSATMTTLGSFDFFIARAGLQSLYSKVVTKTLEANFDYKSQMDILVPTDMPSVKSEDKYLDALSNQIEEWLLASRGQALVLFTSYAMMTEVYDRVKSALLKEGIGVYIQDDTVSRDELLRKFRDERFSVLFATKTFWEGIDVQGLSLQLLIITRLPFPNPSDINEKALEKCLKERGEDKFWVYDLPVAGMLLRQAVGRLIRSETDSGLVIITDTRIVTGSYASQLQGSLPVPVKKLKSAEITEHIQTKIMRD